MRAKRRYLFGCGLLPIAFGASLASAEPPPGQWTEPRAWAGGPILGPHSRQHPQRLSRGNLVAMWQWMMNHACVATPTLLATDGIYGSLTQAATLRWQANLQSQVPKVRVTLDGIVGGQTWNLTRFLYLSKVSADAQWDTNAFKPTSSPCRDLCNHDVMKILFNRPFKTWFFRFPISGEKLRVNWPQISADWTEPCTLP